MAKSGGGVSEIIILVAVAGAIVAWYMYQNQVTVGTTANPITFPGEYPPVPVS